MSHGSLLLEYTDAMMGEDEERLARSRDQIRAQLGDSGWHEAAATVANFNQMDRIADSTGIPLDPPGRKMMTAVGREIGSDAFRSAQNTLKRMG